MELFENLFEKLKLGWELRRTLHQGYSAGLGYRKGLSLLLFSSTKLLEELKELIISIGFSKVFFLAKVWEVNFSLKQLLTTTKTEICFLLQLLEYCSLTLLRTSLQRF